MTRFAAFCLYLLFSILLVLFLKAVGPLPLPEVPLGDWLILGFLGTGKFVNLGVVLFRNRHG